MKSLPPGNFVVPRLRDAGTRNARRLQTEHPSESRTARLLQFLAAALTLTATAQTPPAEDSLFMNDAAGSIRTGRIVGIDADTLKLQVSLPGGGTGAKATVSVPRSGISHIEFAADETRDRILANAGPASLVPVAVLWRRWEPYLGLPKSPAGKIANVHADLLLRTGDPGRAAEALNLFTRVESETWSDDERTIARQGRLRAMVATGNAAGAINEAKELAAASENPEVLIEAKFILAEAAHAQLEKLVEENPRWIEDINVRPEYYRLTHEALDLYLYPYLFYGSETESAARGLSGAIEVYRFTGDTHNALESARDIAVLYAGTRYAKPANEFIAGLPEEILQQDNEKEAQDETQRN